jgi:hypothetical protein
MVHGVVWRHPTVIPAASGANTSIAEGRCHKPPVGTPFHWGVLSTAWDAHRRSLRRSLQTPGAYELRFLIEGEATPGDQYMGLEARVFDDIITGRCPGHLASFLTKCRDSGSPLCLVSDDRTLVSAAAVAEVWSRQPLPSSIKCLRLGPSAFLVPAAGVPWAIPGDCPLGGTPPFASAGAALEFLLNSTCLEGHAALSTGLGAGTSEGRAGVLVMHGLESDAELMEAYAQARASPRPDQDMRTDDPPWVMEDHIKGQAQSVPACEGGGSLGASFLQGIAGMRLGGGTLFHVSKHLLRSSNFPSPAT